jgi:hypothetical protein
MKFRLFVAALAAAMLLAAGFASADDHKALYFNPKLVAGLGPTLGKTYHESGNTEFHVSVGATLLSLDRAGHIGFLGAGTALNVYGFSLDPAELRDLSRQDGGGLTGYANVVGTIVPVRIGPLAYQFSWSGHVRSLGRDRGRLHLITLDVLGLIRLVTDPNL